jgi:hypothetical protein
MIVLPKKPIFLLASVALAFAAITIAVRSVSAGESKPKLVIESPARGQTMKPIDGLDSAITVKWRVENFRIARLGDGEREPGSKQPAMAKADSRAMRGEGFLHVSVDNAPWFLVHSNSEPIVVAGFSPGSHKITLELVGLEHQALSPPERASVSFTVGGN